MQYTERIMQPEKFEGTVSNLYSDQDNRILYEKNLR